MYDIDTIKLIQAPLWKVMELLENYFGSLVGAIVAMTPKKMELPLQNNDMEVRSCLILIALIFPSFHFQ